MRGGLTRRWWVGVCSVLRALLVVYTFATLFLILGWIGMAFSGMPPSGLGQVFGALAVLILLLIAYGLVSKLKARLIESKPDGLPEQDSVETP